MSPPGEFVSRQMIPCSMGRSRSRMGVGCEVVQFRGSIVYALRHGVPDLKRIAWVRVRLPGLPLALAVRRTAPLFSGRYNDKCGWLRFFVVSSVTASIPGFI